MSDASLFEELRTELAELSVPAQPVEILKKGAAGKDEPRAVVYVNATSPEEIEELNKPLSEATLRSVMGGGNGRRNGRGVKATGNDLEEVTRQRMVDWCKTLIDHTEGFTIKVVNHLFAPAKIHIDLEGSPTLKALFEDVDGRLEIDLGKHAVFAALMVQKCRKSEFETLIANKATSAAEEYVAELEGKGNA